MKDQPYLSFSLGDRKYSLHTTYLEEMFPLPEITLLPTVSQDIIGILNVRGNIIPILDPKLSLGLEPTPYKPTDSIIVLKQSQLQVGLIVNNIGALETFSTTDIDPTDARLQEQQSKARRKDMIAGKIQFSESAEPTVDPEPFWLLNEPEKWLRYVEIQQLISIAGALEDVEAAAASDPAPATAMENSEGTQPLVFCPEAKPEERVIFQQRAQELKKSLATEKAEALSTLAIVAIEDKYFGVDLALVQEFAELQTINPIPCCPPHIVGNMNLRGNILTLIDIREILGQETNVAIHPSLAKPLASPSSKMKAMVVEINNTVAGILVKDVLEAMFPFNTQDQIPLSAEDETDGDAPADPYLQSKIPYGSDTIGVLNLPKLFSQGELIVEEVV